ncbi:MAG: hypothetical protein AB9866_00050 [Syntrophobacteraceae bacterium]
MLRAFYVVEAFLPQLIRQVGQGMALKLLEPSPQLGILLHERQVAMKEARLC